MHLLGVFSYKLCVFVCILVHLIDLIIFFYSSFQVSLLARLHHRNLVNLVGYCVDKGQYMLVYEYMSNGSLENLLYSKLVSGDLWSARLCIYCYSS